MNNQRNLNITAYVLAIAGIGSKIQHWPGANIIICLSAITMLITLFMFAIKDNKESGMSDNLNYFLVGTLAFFIIAAVFKIQHWEGSGKLVIISYALSFILPAVLIAQKNDLKIPRQFMITYFIQILFLLALMRNNPMSQFFHTDEKASTEMSADTSRTTK